jgi:hypothetical protein
MNVLVTSPNLIYLSISLEVSSLEMAHLTKLAKYDIEDTNIALLGSDVCGYIVNRAIYAH